VKYSLECEVISNILIDRAICFVRNEKEYIFSPNENGILNKVKIRKKIYDAAKFYSEISTENSPIKITMKEDPLVRNEIVSDFQYLEGSLGFVTQLTKIFWNEPITEWIPETDEERNKLKVFSAQFRKENSHPPTKLTPNVLEIILRNEHTRSSLTILMSFYREGKVFFDRLEFINAFYDFYFVLEDLFGKESWRNQEVKKNFKASTELQQIINWVLNEVIGGNDRHRKEIIELLEKKKLQYNAEGIIILLVEMRGHLHHFSRKSAMKQKPSPLLQQNYEGLAFLTMAIAMQSILSEMHRVDKLRPAS
jgi:hypothetical protein